MILINLTDNCTFAINIVGDGRDVLCDLIGLLLIYM